ncbi:MAG: hypothetical protein K8M05_14055 [Deltaproteobacteria bacterium]|nr:hypothetical protein [Kofleriaceae bacterium]
MSLTLTLTLTLLLSACGSRSDSATEPDPTGARCTEGEYFLPGCTEDPGIVAGCYERCAGATATCGAGQACATVSVVPACALTGDAACDACAESVALCVPSSE